MNKKQLQSLDFYRDIPYDVSLILRNLNRMCKDRGYSINSHDLIPYSDEEIEKFENFDKMSPIERKDELKHVENILNKKFENVSTNDMRDKFNLVIHFFVKDKRENYVPIRSDKKDIHIYILNSEPKKIDTGECKNRSIFYYKQLCSNYVNHFYQPIFILHKKNSVSGSSFINELLEKYAIKKTQLPEMKVPDPIARWYGAQVGDVFECIRRSDPLLNEFMSKDAMEGEPYYRLVTAHTMIYIK